MQEEQHKQKRMPSEAKAQPRHPPARLVLQPEGNQRPESPPWKLPGKNPVRGREQYQVLGAGTVKMRAGHWTDSEEGV
jgi:hypothetical protein